MGLGQSPPHWESVSPSEHVGMTPSNYQVSFQSLHFGELFLLPTTHDLFNLKLHQREQAWQEWSGMGREKRDPQARRESPPHIGQPDAQKKPRVNTVAILCAVFFKSSLELGGYSR